MRPAGRSAQTASIMTLFLGCDDRKEKSFDRSWQIAVHLQADLYLLIRYLYPDVLQKFFTFKYLPTVILKEVQLASV